MKEREKGIVLVSLRGAHDGRESLMRGENPSSLYVLGAMRSMKGARGGRGGEAGKGEVFLDQTVKSIRRMLERPVKRNHTQITMRQILQGRMKRPKEAGL